MLLLPKNILKPLTVSALFAGFKVPKMLFPVWFPDELWSFNIPAKAAGKSLLFIFLKNR